MQVRDDIEAKIAENANTKIVLRNRITAVLPFASDAYVSDFVQKLDAAGQCKTHWHKVCLPALRF